MGESNAGDEEEGAGVGGVANVSVEAFCDKAMLGVDCKVKCEELAECAEAIETDVSAEQDGERADEEEGCCADGRWGGGAAKGELEAGVGLSGEEAFEEGAEPEQRHVDAEDERGDAQEPPLLCVVALPVHRRVRRSARKLVGRRLGKTQNSARERHPRSSSFPPSRIYNLLSSHHGPPHPVSRRPPQRPRPSPHCRAPASRRPFRGTS